MRLIYTASQVNVMVGDTCYLRDGQEVTVQSFAKPHKPSSSGKVYVATVGSPVYKAEYFVGVIGAEWIEREDRAAEDDELLRELGELVDTSSTPVQIVDYYDMHPDLTLRQLAVRTGRSVSYLRGLLLTPA
jgi:hypothetical protein